MADINDQENEVYRCGAHFNTIKREARHLAESISRGQPNGLTPLDWARIDELTAELRAELSAIDPRPVRPASKRSPDPEADALMAQVQRRSQEWIERTWAAQGLTPEEGRHLADQNVAELREAWAPVMRTLTLMVFPDALAGAVEGSRVYREIGHRLSPAAQAYFMKRMRPALIALVRLDEVRAEHDTVRRIFG